MTSWLQHHPSRGKTANNHERYFRSCFSSLSSSVATFTTTCSHQHGDTPRRAFCKHQTILNAFVMAMEITKLQELLVITIYIHRTSLDGNHLRPRVVVKITYALSACPRSIIIRVQRFAVFLAEDNSFSTKWPFPQYFLELVCLSRNAVPETLLQLSFILGSSTSHDPPTPVDFIRSHDISSGEVITEVTPNIGIAPCVVFVRSDSNQTQRAKFLVLRLILTNFPLHRLPWRTPSSATSTSRIPPQDVTAQNPLDLHSQVNRPD